MDSQSICYLSLQELAAHLGARELTSLEATRAVLDRIRTLNPKLRAYITVMEESAVRQASAADKEIGAGRWRGPLHGVPVAVKDLCWTRGVPTTCASKLLRDWCPDSNATVVDRFEAAGAVLIGKLHMTEFAVVWYHPEFPSPLNPWDPSLWPGASSSGSGVAAATGLCFAAIGSDTGGSIRFPSAACGVVGLKPTWGRVSRHGVFPLGESLDHIGPITRTVADAALVLSVIAGEDSKDETSLTAPVEDYVAALGRGAKGLVIGVDESYIGIAAPTVADSVHEAIYVLEKQGARIRKVALPNFEPSINAWTTLCLAEVAAAHAETFPKRASDYGPGIRSFLERGVRVRGHEYAAAHMARESFSNRFQTLFDQIDLLACPTAPFVSLPANQLAPDASVFQGTNTLLSYTAPFNLSRNPTLSMPCGAASGGPPPSLQLVGRRLEEATLFAAGAAYQRATRWHEQRPPLSW